MVGVEVLHEHDGEPAAGLVREGGEELLDGGEAAGRGADAHDGEDGAGLLAAGGRRALGGGSLLPRGLSAGAPRV